MRMPESATSTNCVCVAVFTDDRVGGIFGGERQQLRKQFLADDDGMAALAFVGRNEDRRAGGFEMLFQFGDDSGRDGGMIDEAKDDGFRRVGCGRCQPQLQ